MDAIMGSGKTSAVINMINNAGEDEHFIFVTEYLSECERVAKACSDKCFIAPRPTGDKATKTSGMETLVQYGANIVCTHSLFRRFTDEILVAVRRYKYTLIIDEVMNSTVKLTARQTADFKELQKEGKVCYSTEEKRYVWNGEIPIQWSAHHEFYKLLGSGAITRGPGEMGCLRWVFPEKVLRAFSNIYILTFMFDCQIMRAYLDYCGLSYNYLGTRKREGAYELCSPEDAVKPDPALRDKIHIHYNDRHNQIGEDGRSALSSAWVKRNLERQDGGELKRLGLNIRNIRRGVFNCKTKDLMWTVINNSARKYVEDSTIKMHFVQFNARATNKYGNRHYLAYGANVFMDVSDRLFFTGYGIEIDQDRWALSVLLQWMWRSAIRNGEDIYIYLPSSRMRGLLEDWLKSLGGEEKDRDAA